MSNKTSNCDELRQMISKTKDARFKASRRLSRHNKLSLASLSFFSAVLVLVSLFQLAGYKFSLDDVFVNTGQIFLSIVILCLSIALGMSDFGLRSFMHHSCGVELNKIVYELMNRWGVTLSDAEYKERLDRYFEILDKYENHSSYDLEASGCQLKVAAVKFFKFFMEYFIYIFLFIFSVGWLFFLFIWNLVVV